MSTILSLISFALVTPLLLFVLASTVLSFLVLIAYLEDQPAVARHWARTASLASFLFMATVAYAESLPLLVALVATTTHIALFALVSSLCYPKSRPSGLQYAVALLFLPFTTHFLLLRHLATLHTQWHAYRNAPRLPGGRLNWDIVPSSRPEYGLRDALTLFIVAPAWPAATMCAAAAMASTGYGWATDSLPMALTSSLRLQYSHLSRP